MKKPLLKRKTRNKVIIALALAHCYLCPVLIALISLTFGGENLLLFMGIGCCLYAAYTIVGYNLRWKHIYCSIQTAHRQKMTPDNIRWGTLKKSDVYGVPVIFGVLGVICIVCHFLFFYL